jgi:hypothetical protein
MKNANNGYTGMINTPVHMVSWLTMITLLVARASVLPSNSYG